MKRKVNKKKRKLFLLLILVLLVSVGYALLSTTLNINGTTKVKNATWNIYWDNAQVTTGSVTTTAPTIDSAKTTATFNVELEKPGDFYEFTIDAKNDGTIDGMISNISYKLNDTEIGLENPLPAYLNYTVTYSDDVELAANHLLAANSKETYKVRVEFKKNIENNQLPGQEVTLSLKFAVTYVQAENAVARNGVNPAPTNPYETKFDGTYTYRGLGSQEFGALNDEWDVFLRNDGTNLEICGVYGSGNEDVVCLVSGNYENDFEDCTNDEPDYDGTGETCIKGYTKAKADEMLSKGASSCSISNYYGLSCNGPIVSSCGVVPSGNVGCYHYSDTGCDVQDNSVLYCDF